MLLDLSSNITSPGIYYILIHQVFSWLLRFFITFVFFFYILTKVSCFIGCNCLCPPRRTMDFHVIFVDVCTFATELHPLIWHLISIILPWIIRFDPGSSLFWCNSGFGKLVQAGRRWYDRYFIEFYRIWILMDIEMFYSYRNWCRKDRTFKDISTRVLLFFIIHKYNSQI